MASIEIDKQTRSALDEYSQARLAVKEADPDLCERIANDARGLLALREGVLDLSRTRYENSRTAAPAAYRLTSIQRWGACEPTTLATLLDESDEWSLVLLLLLVSAREADDRPSWSHYGTAARRFLALNGQTDARRRRFSEWADTYERARRHFQAPSEPPPGISRAEAVALWEASRVLVNKRLTDDRADDDGDLVALLQSFGLRIRTHDESKDRLKRERLLF